MDAAPDDDEKKEDSVELEIENAPGPKLFRQTTFGAPKPKEEAKKEEQPKSMFNLASTKLEE